MATYNNPILLINQIKEKVIVAILGDDEIGEQLVLKGGNLLQFAYQLTTRASRDVDISVDGEFEDTAVLSTKVSACLERAFSEIGLTVFDFTFVEVPAKISDDLKSFWGGYQCEFKLATKEKFAEHKDDIETLRRCAYMVDGTGGTKFKVDFSRHEFCDDKEPFDVGGYTIHGYSPRMFVAEKLRAICQQMPEYGPIVHRTRPAASRARDFVDVYVICETYGVDFGSADFHKIVGKTFEAKRVPIEWLSRVGKTRAQHEPDFQSVIETVAPTYKQRLQDFDFYFAFVCRQCSQLEALWDI